MKTNLFFKIIIGFTLLLTRFDSSAQNYTPFPEDSAVWTLQYKPYNGGIWLPSYAINLTIKGDTIINAISYNKLYSDSKGYLCGYRNDIQNKRVYFIRADSSNEELAFDFNLLLDSTIIDFGNNPFVVKHVDSVLIDNKKYKAYFNYLSKSGYSIDAAILEGIGSRRFIAGLLREGLAGGDRVMTCFEIRNLNEEDNKITSGCRQTFITGSSFEFKTSLVKVFPNPCKGQLLIEGMETIKKIKVFNVTGQLEVILSSLDKSGNQYQIKLPENLNGLYWLEFDNGYRTKIVVE